VTDDQVRIFGRRRRHCRRRASTIGDQVIDATIAADQPIDAKAD
jgi:hypothetical protein